MQAENNQIITVQEAGRRGGLRTLCKLGRKHFSDIGRKGQTALSLRAGTAQRRRWGKMGGRPRKVRPSEGENNYSS